MNSRAKTTHLQPWVHGSMMLACFRKMWNACDRNLEFSEFIETSQNVKIILAKTGLRNSREFLGGPHRPETFSFPLKCWEIFKTLLRLYKNALE